MFDGAFYTALNLEFFGECLRVFQETNTTFVRHAHTRTHKKLLHGMRSWHRGALTSAHSSTLSITLYNQCRLNSIWKISWAVLFFFLFFSPSPLHLVHPRKRACSSDMAWEGSNESSYLTKMRCCGGVLIGGLGSSFPQGRFSEYFEVVSLELKMKGSFAASQILCILSSQ